MNRSLSRCITFALVAGAALPAFAQSEVSSDTWTGAYVGVTAGYNADPDGNNKTVNFDTNLDGQFGDTVRTAAGANAFSPGFSKGSAKGATPAAGTKGNKGGEEYGARVGYDWQSGQLVYGVLAEYAKGDADSSVSAYSTTPAFYTLTRSVDSIGAIRGRVGWAFGANQENLLYTTAGVARAKIENSFATSNTANTFVDNGDSDADGMQLGFGYERKLGQNFSVGLEYLHSRFKDDEYRVRSQGPAPATNPFLQANPNGTDFARADKYFELDNVRLTGTYRF